MENKEQEQQIRGLLYEEEKMKQVISILNTIQVVGVNQIKGMSVIFDILTNPVPFKSVSEEPKGK